MMRDMRIGEAARHLDVATHVLRHWDDERVVIPARDGSGYRDFSEEDLRRARIVRSCQRLGLSLAEIRQVLHRGACGRDIVIERRLDVIRRRRTELDAAERFLGHVRTCQHDLVAQCDECSMYAQDAQSFQRSEADVLAEFPRT